MCTKSRDFAKQIRIQSKTLEFMESHQNSQALDGIQRKTYKFARIQLNVVAMRATCKNSRKSQHRTSKHFVNVSTAD